MAYRYPTGISITVPLQDNAPSLEQNVLHELMPAYRNPRRRNIISVKMEVE